MERITTENVEKEISYILEHKTMTCDNLERFVLLCRTMKYLGRLEHKFTEEHAKKWMEALPGGPHWTQDQTTAVMRQRGYNHKPCVFWAVMNSLYSDYAKTMIRHGADKPEVWADLAADWIDDKDAVEDKVGRYYRDIVRH